MSAFDSWVLDASTPRRTRVCTRPPLPPPSSETRRAREANPLLARASAASAGMHKSAMVGIFLAVLELTRHHNVLAQQSDLHSEIQIVPNDGFSKELDVSNIDDYNPHSKTLPTGDPGSMVD